MHINRQFKDRLFWRIFGSTEYKKYALALYNALNGTNYENADELQLYTIDDAVYMGMKNDVSFILAGTISLYEQQSTFNPNMPLRGLLYFAKQYEKYIAEHRLNLHQPALRRIPTPAYYVFYNGEKDVPERTELRLSDAFLVEKDGQPCLEVVATVLNINAGQNRALLSQCKPLSDYASFVNRVKLYLSEGFERTEAVEKAVEDAIKEDLLEGYFRKHKAEAVDMILAEYDAEDTMRGFYEYGREEGYEEGRQEGWHEGRQEGRQEGREEGQNGAWKAVVLEMLKHGQSKEAIAEMTGIPLEKVLRYR